MKVKVFNITAEQGLHARPSTLLVQKASQFSSEIQLVYKDKSVNLKSIMGVMALGIPANSQVTVKAEGADEDAAIAAVEQIMQNEGLGK